MEVFHLLALVQIGVVVVFELLDIGLGRKLSSNDANEFVDPIAFGVSQRLQLVFELIEVDSALLLLLRIVSSRGFPLKLPQRVGRIDVPGFGIEGPRLASFRQTHHLTTRGKL